MKKTRSKSREKLEFRAKLNEVILPTSKLKLCPDQLHNLNFIFQRKLDERRRSNDPNVLLARSVSERLIQRLVCGAGMMDSRFSSKFLITLHNQDEINSTNLKYMIRIDALSLPLLYADDPKPKYNILENESDIPTGYAKIRLHCHTLDDWAEFVNSSGFLRRDKVQARYVELLAKAAANDIPSSPLQVDESTLCGAPGKVVDAETLYYILRLEADQQIFYGASGNSPRYPDPRDLRLAIIDEPGGIRFQIEFLSPALANISINVRLLVVVGVDSWPTSTDFPFRIALGHSDCLLYYTAAQMGMYLVGFGVHSSAWQLRLPGGEHGIMNRYDQNSAIRMIADVLSLILEEMNQRYKKKQMIHKILNKYILKTMLFYELEADHSNPTTVIMNWSPLYLSTHVLKILDKLVKALPNEHISNYFFQKANLLANPGHLCEEDYVIEARKIQQYLVRLFDESLMSFKGNTEFLKMMTLVNTETTLLAKWKEIIDGLSPPQSTRGRRICLAFSTNSVDAAFAQYTCRQLEYVGFVLKTMVNVKETIWQDNDKLWMIAFRDHTRDHPVEDIIYILVTIMEQAKDVYLEQCTNPKIAGKLIMYFNSATGKLIDLVRRDKDITYTNITDDIMLVKIILKWLYKAMDQNRKCFALILRPFLNTIFIASHAISWHMEKIKCKHINEELHALSIFCKLINVGKVTPAQALMDAYSKRWSWAKAMLELVGEGNLRLVFTPKRDKVIRHVLAMPVYRRTKRGKSSDARLNVERSFSFNDRNYFNSLLNREERTTPNRPSYCYIKAMSPLTLTLHESNKRGCHRCYGDIFQSLIKMHKINILQDVFGSLPEDERNQLYEMVHRMSTAKTKKAITTKWSNTLPSTKRVPPHAKIEDIQTYTRTDEDDIFKLDDCRSRLKSTNKFHELMKKLEKKDSLIGSCRAARMKEDNSAIYFHETFKAKSLTLNYRMGGK